MIRLRIECRRFRILAGLAFALWALPATALDILLTNDDGVEAPGIRALAGALRTAGHRVVTVAPNRNYSGTSASMTFDAIPVEQRGPGEFAAAASPATCVLIGLTALQDSENPFDLVVAGINHGANVGAATGISGTVGATTIAITVGDVPAIAFSANNIGEGPDDEGFTQHLQEVAAFSADLVGRLNDRREENGALLPAGTALNVNFPALRSAQVKGFRFGVQGKGSPFGLRFEEKSPGVYAPAFSRGESRPDVPGSDAAALAQGYITAVLLDGDYTAPAVVRQSVEGRLSSSTPGGD